MERGLRCSCGGGGGLLLPGLAGWMWMCMAGWALGWSGLGLPSREVDQGGGEDARPPTSTSPPCSSVIMPRSTESRLLGEGEGDTLASW